MPYPGIDASRPHRHKDLVVDYRQLDVPEPNDSASNPSMDGVCCDRRGPLAVNAVRIHPFVMEQQVRPRHCDAQAMVHAARYHDFCEDALLGWLEHVGISYSALRTDRVDLVISESHFSYWRPAMLEDRLRITVAGQAITDSTLRAAFDVRREPDTLATAEITYVSVRNGRRCALPGVLQGLSVQHPESPDVLLDALHNAQADLYGAADAAALHQLLDPGIVWRVPGNNRIAGTYRGIDEVVAYMRHRRELANATFRMQRQEVLVGPSHFAALTNGTVERAGVVHSWSTVGLYRARDGRISECSLIPLDAAAFDAAWG